MPPLGLSTRAVAVRTKAALCSLSVPTSLKSRSTTWRALEHGRRGLRDERREARGDRGQHERHDPHGRETSGPQDELADGRPDPEPDVQRERQEVQGLAAARIRRKVGTGGEDRHEEEGLGDTEERPRHDEQQKRVDDQVERERTDGHERAGQEQRTSAESIRGPADDRPEDQRADRECAIGDPGAERISPERPGRKLRDDRQHHPAGNEEDERRGTEDDERAGDERFWLGLGTQR